MTHGTGYAYKEKKCHCAECRAWYAEWMRGYRQRRKARGDILRSGKWVTVGD